MRSQTDDERQGIAIIVTDLTLIEAAQTELIRHQQHLEELVAERTTDLAQANRELESFAYSVSHDLRAPLRAIDGFSQKLLKGYADKLDDEGKRLLQVVRTGATKMGQLIVDILTFSRISRQEMAASDADMGSLVQDTLRELAPAIVSRTIEIKVGPLPHVHGDRQMLLRVWTNLLDNAIKYTGRNASAVVEIGAREEGDETVFFIKDNGSGFDMQYAGRLFSVFQRLHSETEFPGTGIGLAIVSRIVTRHGGRVWAESKVGEGATFYFALPIEQASRD
jgi:two-component system sensor kinase